MYVLSYVASALKLSLQYINNLVFLFRDILNWYHNPGSGVFYRKQFD